MGWYEQGSSDSYDEYEDNSDDNRIIGGKSDGEHTTVYREGSHRSWDSDDRGNSYNDHSTDHKTGKITQND